MSCKSIVPGVFLGVFLGVLLGIVPASTRRASAQPLARYVPGDVIAYVGWRGIDDMGPGWDESHFKAVLEATKLPTLSAQFFDTFMRIAQQDDPNAAETGTMVKSMFSAFWHHSCAFYIENLTAEQIENEKPRIAMIWKAGDQATQLKDWLQSLIDKQRINDPGAARVVQKGNLVMFASGYPEQEALLAMRRDDSLQAHKGFRESVASLHDQPAAVGFFDIARVIALVDQAAQQEADEEELKIWQNLKTSLGLGTLGHATVVGGFQGKQWITSAHVEAPAPRRGITHLLDEPALTAEDLRAVPASATWLWVGQLSPTRIMDLVRSTIGQIAPDDRNKFEIELQNAGEQLGIDIERDLIKAMGSKWTAYGDPGMSAMGIGFVLANNLAVPDRANKALIAIEQQINEMMAQNGDADQQGMQMRFREVPYEGVTVHTLALPMFASPSWAIHNGKLYFSTTPQAIVQAVQHEGASILDNPAFQHARKELGDHPANQVTFVDLPKTALQAYQSVAMLLQFLPMMAPELANRPPVMLPPITAIMPHLTPVCQITWMDDAGLHSRGISPLPGAGVLGGNPLMGAGAGSGAMMIGALLPALQSARRTTKNLTSTTNASAICKDAILWADTNDGHMPDHLLTLVRDIDTPLELLISPTSKTTVPADFQRWPMKEQRTWIDEHASYVLIPGLMNNANAREVVVFEKLHSRGQKGIAVAYGDAHVSHLELSEARALIQEQTGRSLEQWSRQPAQGGTTSKKRSTPPPAPF